MRKENLKSRRTECRSMKISCMHKAHILRNLSALVDVCKKLCFYGCMRAHFLQLLFREFFNAMELKIIFQRGFTRCLGKFHEKFPLISLRGKIILTMTLQLKI